MLVVVAIIALIVGISIPAVSAGLDSVRLASATQSAASFLNGAVNRAGRRQQAVEVEISQKENLIALFSADGTFHRELRMPNGIAIAGLLPVIEEEGPTRRLLLQPGSTVPGLGIELANQHGSRRIVRLDPMTGFPRVERVVEK